VSRARRRSAALGAKQHALRVLPGLLNTYAGTTDEPSAEVLADYMARLAQLHAAPPINMQSVVEESESLSARLAAARLTHLAPQFAPSEATAWMAFTHCVAWNMQHPHTWRAFAGRVSFTTKRVTRAVAAGRSDPEALRRTTFSARCSACTALSCGWRCCTTRSGRSFVFSNEDRVDRRTTRRERMTWQ
jgi:hypothetical protein